MGERGYNLDRSNTSYPSHESDNSPPYPMREELLLGLRGGGVRVAGGEIALAEAPFEQLQRNGV